MLAFINLPVALAVLAALAVVLYFFYLVSESDRRASRVLDEQKRRTGLDHAVSNPGVYSRMRALHTSRRVPDMRPSRFARFGL